MTSSNWNIFRVTGPFCRNSLVTGEIPAQRPVTRSFNVFFDLRLNTRLSKQTWGCIFETQSRSLWRHCNGWIQTGVTVRTPSIRVKFGDFIVPCGLEIWQMTLKNNRAPLAYDVKLCTSFQSHRWIQTGVTVRKRSIQVKISDFLSRVTLKFDGWPCKILGHLSYATLSFVHHLKTIGEFKPELQSGNAQFGSKSAILLPAWLWKLTDELEKQ